MISAVRRVVSLSMSIRRAFISVSCLLVHACTTSSARSMFSASVSSGGIIQSYALFAAFWMPRVRLPMNPVGLGCVRVRGIIPSWTGLMVPNSGGGLVRSGIEW